MKKVLCIFIITLIMCFALCGCNQNNVDSNSHTTGTITIVSGGETYTPLENWICDYDNGTARDGARKQPEEVVEELVAIPYEDDFQIVIDGEPLKNQYYTLFNDKFEEEYYRQSDFAAPQNNGEYILFVELTWGDEKNYSGYQYCFKLEVSKNTGMKEESNSESLPSSTASENIPAASSSQANSNSSSTEPTSQANPPVSSNPIESNVSVADPASQNSQIITDRHEQLYEAVSQFMAEQYGDYKILTLDVVVNIKYANITIELEEGVDYETIKEIVRNLDKKFGSTKYIDSYVDMIQVTSGDVGTGLVID